MITLKKKIENQGLDQKAIQEHTSHFHPPSKIHKTRPSTHSSDYETSLLLLLG
jgi:hypothetical protein